MKKNLQSKVAKAALELLANEAWDSLSPDKLAAQADLPLPQIQKAFPIPRSLIPAIVDWVDEKTESAEPDATAAPADTLFELLMNRFETMGSFKPSFVALAETIRRRPPEAFTFYHSFRPFLAKALLLSQPKAERRPSEAQIVCLAGIYAFTFFRWAEDKTPDMCRTMAALNGAIKSCEEFLFRTLEI